MVGHDGFARLASGHIEEAERAHGNDGIGNGIGLDVDDHLAVRARAAQSGSASIGPRGAGIGERGEPGDEPPVATQIPDEEPLVLGR